MELLKQYALRFVGIPYRWGGDDSIEGFDCSGFIRELLASCGEGDPSRDQSSQSLYDWFSTRGHSNYGPQAGALLFFGKSVTEITHVAMGLDQYRMIEAGGGGSKVVDLASAIKQNAYIRVRLIKNRKDLVAVIRPYYHLVGNL